MVSFKNKHSVWLCFAMASLIYREPNNSDLQRYGNQPEWKRKLSLAAGVCCNLFPMSFVAMMAVFDSVIIYDVPMLYLSGDEKTKASWTGQLGTRSRHHNITTSLLSFMTTWLVLGVIGPCILHAHFGSRIWHLCSRHVPDRTKQATYSHIWSYIARTRSLTGSPRTLCVHARMRAHAGALSEHTMCARMVHCENSSPVVGMPEELLLLICLFESSWSRGSIFWGTSITCHNEGKAASADIKLDRPAHFFFSISIHFSDLSCYHGIRA